ncbi:hypothetical protein GC197_10550 [bacterium]|nr:hypothetical protein [bacterium]
MDKRAQSMDINLLFDGYYYTGPREWEDWHAGVRMHGIRFSYIRYYPDGTWLSCYRDHEFAFWEFSESLSRELFADAMRDRAPRIADADPLCTAGKYSIDHDILTETLAPDWTGGQTWNSRYRILVDRLVSVDDDASAVAWLFQPQPIS